MTVKGLNRLRPSYITRRFSKFSGQTYSPDLVDERFRDLMRSGLFTVLQIKPTPIGGDALRLDITAEEAKSKEFGFLPWLRLIHWCDCRGELSGPQSFRIWPAADDFSRMERARLQG